MFFYQLTFELFNSTNKSISYIPNNIFEPITNIQKNDTGDTNNNDTETSGTSTINETLSKLNNIDFRFGPINIECIDMDDKIVDSENNLIENLNVDNNDNDNVNNSNNVENENLSNHAEASVDNTSSLNNEKINTSSTTSQIPTFFDFNTKKNTPYHPNLNNNSKSQQNPTSSLSTFLPNNVITGHDRYEQERQQYIKINEKKIKKHGFIPVSGGFIPYSSENTRFDIGILHLYRGLTPNNNNTNVQEDNYFIEDTNEISPDTTSPATDLPNNNNNNDNNNNNNNNNPLSYQNSQPTPSHLPSYTENIKKCKIVCVLAVPSHMSTIDFLNFVGPIRKYVSHFRIINDTLPNRFMVLMMFRKTKHAYDFVSHYNGIQFNSLEPETCHAVFIEKIEFQAKDLPSHLILFPDNPIAIEDLKKMEEERNQQRQQQQQQDDNAIATTDTTSITDNDSSNSSTPLLEKKSSNPPKNKGIIISSSHQRDLTKSEQAELPICPVCLERMDASVTGLLTILCQHTFHCHCLSKWQGNTCPVCRYSQKSFLGNDQQNECSTCQSTENLWICLICGNIGCGRYQQAHAYQHFLETNHLYSLEIETQRVWDYAGDGYVHRLIQNKVDGKLVELPSPSIGNEDSQSNRLLQEQQQQQQNQQQLANSMLTQMNNDKISYLSSEYNDLLTSQLESQKYYFENQMEDMKKVFNVQLHNLSDYYENINMAKSKEISELNEKLQQEFNQNQSLEKEKNEYFSLMNNLLKEKKTMEKKIEKSESLKKEYLEEKLLTKVLLENQDKLKNLVDEKDKEINDLREQVRDLMFYLDAKSKVENCENKEEIQNGTIMLPSEEGSSSSPSVSKRKKKPKNKKKK